jgi:hypothetical protein
MGQQVLALAALMVGVEDEARRVEALEEDHAHGRRAVRSHGGQAERRRIVGFALVGFGVPRGEKL